MFIFLDHLVSFFFFFNDTATTEIYTLSLHDALPICRISGMALLILALLQRIFLMSSLMLLLVTTLEDRKSGSAGMPRPISYAVFCLKKKKTKAIDLVTPLQAAGHAQELQLRDGQSS